MARTRATQSAIGRKYPKPPEGMGATGEKLWNDICRSYGFDHFSPADLPLLENYVRCVLIVHQCNQALGEDGIFVDDGKKAHPGLAVRDSQIKNMASLATKLRLPVSSRIRSEHAETRPAHGKKPWEHAADDPASEFFSD